MGKHVTCPQCGKEHYATFTECPWCPATDIEVLDAEEAQDPLAETGESDSLAAGSGSGKYPEPGTTDWTDSGHPDYEPPT